jgi:error-prone DNA polymerase
MNLEDETGVVNVLCSKGLWTAYRKVARESPALIVRGILQRSPDGVTTIVADRLDPLEFSGEHRSRDFR